jgi:hypothetical protein
VNSPYIRSGPTGGFGSSRASLPGGDPCGRIRPGWFSVLRAGFRRGRRPTTVCRPSPERRIATRRGTSRRSNIHRVTGRAHRRPAGSAAGLGVLCGLEQGAPSAPDVLLSTWVGPTPVRGWRREPPGTKPGCLPIRAPGLSRVTAPQRPHHRSLAPHPLRRGRALSRWIRAAGNPRDPPFASVARDGSPARRPCPVAPRPPFAVQRRHRGPSASWLETPHPWILCRGWLRTPTSGRAAGPLGRGCFHRAPGGVPVTVIGAVQPLRVSPVGLAVDGHAVYFGSRFVDAGAPPGPQKARPPRSPRAAPPRRTLGARSNGQVASRGPARRLTASSPWRPLARPSPCPV